MGKADYYEGGGWNNVCYECGRKFKASEMRRHWQGYYVCWQHWEPRHTQDFVRPVADNVNVPWSQPETHTYVQHCTPNTVSDVPGFAEPGCMIPGFISPAFDPTIVGG